MISQRKQHFCFKFRPIEPDIKSLVKILSTPRNHACLPKPPGTDKKQADCSTKEVKNKRDDSINDETSLYIINETNRNQESDEIDDDEHFYTPKVLAKSPSLDLSIAESSSSSYTPSSAESLLSIDKSPKKTVNETKCSSIDNSDFVFDLKTCIKYLNYCKMKTNNDLKLLESSWLKIDKSNTSYAYLKEAHIKHVQSKQQVLNSLNILIQENVKAERIQAD